MGIMESYPYGYNEKEPVTCHHCKWQGTIGECIEKRVVSSPQSWQQLGGRDGWEYLCPKCKWIVTAIWNRMS